MNIDSLTQLNMLQDFFGGGQANPSLEGLLFNAVLLVVMSMILGVVYVWSGSSLSNRKRTATTFPLLALTTMMVISIIQSSLALSLGLVGALSIIRFRSAIKEPEELVYIFLVVSLGLGFGAQQRVVTLAFFGVILMVLVGSMLLRKRIPMWNWRDESIHYVDITFSHKNENEVSIGRISELLVPYCKEVAIKRVDISDNKQTLLFQISVTEVDQLENLIDALDKNLVGAELTVTQHESLFA